MTNPPDEFVKAKKLINKFREINGLKFRRDLIIKIDFTIKEAGYYLYEDDTFSIHVNPSNCTNNRAYVEYGDRDEVEYSFSNYSCDGSIYGTVLHEFSHFLQYQIFKTILNDYKKQFPTNRLVMMSYVENNVEEELTEIIRLYLQNPLLLKLISPNVHKFVQQYMKSPTPCTHKTSFKMFNQFPIDVRRDLQEKWCIVYNVSEQRFEKVEK